MERGAWVCCVGISAQAALGQCTPQWSAYSGPQLDNIVYCVTTWDPDGNGPAAPVVVAGGNFEHVGATSLNYVASWNGTSWQSVGIGVNGTVLSAGEVDASWSGGRRLVIGGAFTASGTTTVNLISMFDGASWLPLGGGLGPPQNPVEVDTFAQFGNQLAVGGIFSIAGTGLAPGLARWDGTNWSAFSDTTVGSPIAVATFGSSLYAGFRGSTGVRRWDSPTWVRIGAAPNDDVSAITEYRGELIAAGWFTNLGSHIARWNGTSWQPLGQGINGNVYALKVFDPDGPGPMPDLLIAGGLFSSAGGVPSSCIAAWNGTNWAAMGAGTSNEVDSLTVWNNELVAGGFFFQAGGLVSPGVAFWGCPQVPVCYANCDLSNASPALNINDFVCFINRFAAGESYANCDQSTAPPVLNVLDFSCFLTKFAGGCT